MKQIFLILLIIIVTISCKAQTYPLTASELPANSYRKDINNDLPAFEGNWKGTWKGKTFLINFKKLINQYNDALKIYNDQLIGKFQVKDSSGNILFDNLNITDNEAKIVGGKIFPDGTYSLTYLDSELCSKMGLIRLTFTNSSKTELKFKFMEWSQLIDTDCFLSWKASRSKTRPSSERNYLDKTIIKGCLKKEIIC
jgi:hypothetical protein